MILHNLLELLGYFAGVLLYSFLRTRRGDSVSDRARLDVIIGAALGAALGSRILWWLGEPGVPVTQFFGGKTIVGGLLGGLIGVEVTKKIRGISTSTGDLFVLPLIVAIAIGRIGCFLAGPADHTAGNPTNLPWAVTIGDNVPRHPVALYEIAFLLALIPLVMRMRVPGDRFRVFLASYLFFRLSVDFIKPFPLARFAGLTAIQWACIAGLAYYASVFARRAVAPAEVTS